MKPQLFPKFLLALFAFCFLNNSLYADKPRVKGYHIDNNGTKFQVLIVVPTGLLSDKVSQQFAQDALHYIDKKNQKQTLLGYQIKEYGFTYQGVKYVYHSFSDGEEKEGLFGLKIRDPFYRLLQDGAVKLYLVSLQHSGANGSTSTSTEYMFWRHNHDTFTTGTALFKKSGQGSNERSLEDYFNDCPELSTKIKNKEYKNGDDRFERIAIFYNTKCKEKAVEAEKEEAEKKSEE